MYLYALALCAGLLNTQSLYSMQMQRSKPRPPALMIPELNAAKWQFQVYIVDNNNCYKPYGFTQRQMEQSPLLLRHFTHNPHLVVRQYTADQLLFLKSILTVLASCKSEGTTMEAIAQARKSITDRIAGTFCLPFTKKELLQFKIIDDFELSSWVLETIATHMISSIRPPDRFLKQIDNKLDSAYVGFQFNQSELEPFLFTFMGLLSKAHYLRHGRKLNTHAPFTIALNEQWMS